MSKFSKQLEWVDSQQGRMVETVEAWSGINSGSHNFDGIRKMGAAAATAFASLGAELEVRETKAAKKVSQKGDVEMVTFGPVYHFKKRPKANRKVLLTGHLDTVFPKDHPFQKPTHLDRNTLGGPGVADMKGGLMVMLVALEALERSGLGESLGYEILLNSDEEIGSIGSAPMLAECAARADFGMTFEPALADGTLAGDRKGSGNFSVVMRGRGAHAGREFEKGINAISALSELVVDLQNLNGKQDGLTVNPALIQGGSAPNVVPDLAICRLNVRVKTVDQGVWFEAAFKKILAKYNAREGLKAEGHGHFTRVPKVLTEANLKLFEVLRGLGREIGIEVKWAPTGGCCDGNNLAAAGLPNIDTLGVRGGSIHTDQEFALLDSFAERAKLSTLLLLNYASGNFRL